MSQLFFTTPLRGTAIQDNLFYLHRAREPSSQPARHHFVSPDNSTSSLCSVCGRSLSRETIFSCILVTSQRWDEMRPRRKKTKRNDGPVQASPVAYVIVSRYIKKRIYLCCCCGWYSGRLCKQPNEIIVIIISCRTGLQSVLNRNYFGRRAIKCLSLNYHLTKAWPLRITPNYLNWSFHCTQWLRGVFN